MKPQLSLFKNIDGSRSLREFSSKNYKHLSKLKVIKLENTIRLGRLTKQIPPLLHKLIISTKSLDLSQYNLENYRFTLIELITKKIHRIPRLSLFGNKSSSAKSLFFAETMLKNAPNLRHLSFKDIFDVSPDIDPNQELLRLISKSQLKSIDLILNKTKNIGFVPALATFPGPGPKWLLDFSSYCPLTLEELSLSWSDYIDGFGLKLPSKQFSNLQRLALGFPIDLETFTSVLKAVPNPSKLKTLKFHLAKSIKIAPYLKKLEAFLESCSNLEELDLKTNIGISLRTVKLKKLSIEITSGVLRLADFMPQQNESLEVLSLISLQSRPHGLSPVLYPPDTFLEAVKSLKQLKKLCLNVKVEKSHMNAVDLTEIFEALEFLEEVDFQDQKVEFTEDSFPNFCEALQKRSGSLKSLKLCFNSFVFNKTDSRLWLQTLASLYRLEHITFKNFVTGDPNFYDGLKEIVCYQGKSLNEVFLFECLKREKSKADCETVIKMLKEMVKKPTMKKLWYNGDAKISGFALNFKNIQVLNLPRDVLKQIHHFDYLNLPAYTCKPPCLPREIGLYKWL